jgi:MoaA/NifB/PqqE/SkfB family radical SAM enzyme
MAVEATPLDAVIAGRGFADLPLPEPVPDIAAYTANRERALAADPRKRANYELFERSDRRAAAIPYQPLKLDIENVSRCNLACTMCVVSDWPKRRRAEDMSFADFQRLIDEQYGLLEIKLQGIGEPTMQGDAFFDMIRYARARHIWVRTTTNGTLLHLNDNARKLVDSGVNEIQISIDGPDAATYETIRCGAKFDRVTRNVAALNAHCAEQGKILTKMWTVVQAANRDRLRDLVHLAARIGFKRQVFSLELSDWGSDSWNTRNAEVSVRHDLDSARLFDLVALGESLGVQVRFWTVLDKYERTIPSRLCPWPFERAYVSSDRRIAPCCYIGNPDVFAIEDRPIESFDAVWHGPAMAAFRRRHLEDDLPEVCRSCYRQA